MIELFFSIITDRLFFLLLENNNLVGKISEDNENFHSENFILKLSSLLKNCGIKLRDIDNVFFLDGPGSQTGERIGVTFVTALKLVSPNFQSFKLDSLTFQAGLNKNCLSAISFGKKVKKFFLNVYFGGELISSKKKVSCEDLESNIKKFPEFPVFIDFAGIDFFELFVNMKKKFVVI